LFKAQNLISKQAKSPWPVIYLILNHEMVELSVQVLELFLF
jgi:hypothetical protein